MFKHKKKTGVQTPEYRCPTPPPAIKPNPNYIPPATVAKANPPNTGSSVQSEKNSCLYETPCGWCSKWDKKCDKKIGGEPVSIPTSKSRAHKFIDDIKSGNLPPLDTKDTYGLENTK